MVIIAAVDRSEHAKKVASEAEKLAQAFEDPLVLVHVMSRSEFVEIESENVEESGQAVDIDRIRETAAKHASKAGEELEISFEAKGSMGKVETVVNELAAEKGARYIVIGGRKRSPTGKAIFGSVTQDILLSSDKPVVTVI